MSLEGKVAVITGAGSGFGAGMARRFVEGGARVIVVDRNIEGAERVAGQLGGNAHALACDVSRQGDAAAAAAASLDRFGHVDILVNNAGIGHRPTSAELVEPDEFDRIAGVNMRGVYLMTRVFVPHMKQNRSGVIVNIASTGANRPRPNLAWYNATKGWVVSATKALAIELAPFNIRVVALNPVAGETPLLATFMGEDSEEIRRKFRETIPLGRLLKPGDLAEAAAFVASDQAAMITGIALDVDGGRSI